MRLIGASFLAVAGEAKKSGYFCARPATKSLRPIEDLRLLFASQPDANVG